MLFCQVAYFPPEFLKEDLAYLNYKDVNFVLSLWICSLGKGFILIKKLKSWRIITALLMWNLWMFNMNQNIFTYLWMLKIEYALVCKQKNLHRQLGSVAEMMHMLFVP